MMDVRLDNISKTFGRKPVLKNITLEIKRGEFFTILGPSGSGKTTILRIIAGLEKPDHGKVYFNNIDVTDTPAHDREVSMIFQSLALYPHLTVFENIAFPLRVRKRREEDVKKTVKEIASTLRIEDILNRNISSLSGGEKQRVALARALVYQPKIFLMDEPLTGLEPAFRQELRREIKSLQRSTGITTVYVTHDQVEAFSLADRVALLHEGVLQCVDEPQRVYEKPENLFVAKFVGDTPLNIFTATVEPVGNGALVKIDDIGVVFRTNITKIPAGGKVLAAARAEAFRVDENHAALSGVVVGREVLGDRIVYTVDVKGRDIVVKTGAHTVYNKSTQIRLAIDVDKFMLFDEEGRRL